jgi:uncharacterized membrane protein
MTVCVVMSVVQKMIMKQRRAFKMAEDTLDRGTMSTGVWMSRLRVVAIVLALAGVFIAGYLSYAEVLLDDAGSMACPAHDQEFLGLPIDCGNVNNSKYATLFGILPIALFGLMGYLMIFGVLVLEDRIPLLKEYGTLLFFGLTLFGFVFSMYLTWAEVVKIKAFCSWCVTQATVMTVLFIIAAVRWWREFTADDWDDEDDYEAA